LNAGSKAENVPPLVSEALGALLPPENEIASEVLNTQYLQAHSNDARAIIDAAWGARLLESNREEIENILFGTLNENVSLNLKVRSHGMLTRARLSCLSSRHKLFSIACMSLSHRVLMNSVWLVTSDLNIRLCSKRLTN
jgi:N-alpha-acetyltransferase 15/16, NatA auxiliary subunit